MNFREKCANPDRAVAVYGAFVALQVRDRIHEGHGPPDEILMRRFVEEAEAVALMADEAFVAMTKEEESA